MIHLWLATIEITGYIVGQKKKWGSAVTIVYLKGTNSFLRYLSYLYKPSPAMLKAFLSYSQLQSNTLISVNWALQVGLNDERVVYVSCIPAAQVMQPQYQLLKCA